MLRHLECQNPFIISDSIGIPNGGEKNGKMSEEEERRRRRRSRNLIHIEEDWVVFPKQVIQDFQKIKSNSVE